MNEGGRAWIPFSGLARVVDTDLSGCVCLAGPCLWTWKAAACVARHLFPSSTSVCLLRKHSSFRCPQLTAPPAGASLLEKVFFKKKTGRPRDVTPTSDHPVPIPMVVSSYTAQLLLFCPRLLVRRRRSCRDEPLLVLDHPTI
jgi:hypothetical protein